MNILYTILTTAVTTILVSVGVYNYMPVEPIFSLLQGDGMLGATITTIAGSDTLKASRTVINDNFTNLNTSKIEISTTTLPNITTLTGLTTTGTIGTGAWEGTGIGVAYQGTGTTSPTTKQIMFGYGSSGFQVIGFGTSGQLLKSGGDDTLPSWDSVAVNETLDYTWTGQHDFSATTSFANITSSVVSTYPSASSSIATKGYSDVENTKVYILSASDTLRDSADTERTVAGDASATYELVKSIQVNKRGEIRVKFDLHVDVTYDGTVSGQIYVNGVAVGTERSNSSHTYVEYSEDIDIVSGDFVQLYYKRTTGAGASATGYAENFRIYGTETRDYDNDAVITD